MSRFSPLADLGESSSNNRARHISYDPQYGVNVLYTAEDLKLKGPDLRRLAALDEGLFGSKDSTDTRVKPWRGFSAKKISKPIREEWWRCAEENWQWEPQWTEEALSACLLLDEAEYRRRAASGKLTLTPSELSWFAALTPSQKAAAANPLKEGQEPECPLLGGSGLQPSLEPALEQEPAAAVLQAQPAATGGAPLTSPPLLLEAPPQLPPAAPPALPLAPPQLPPPPLARASGSGQQLTADLQLGAAGALVAPPTRPAPPRESGSRWGPPASFKAALCGLAPQLSGAPTSPLPPPPPPLPPPPPPPPPLPPQASFSSPEAHSDYVRLQNAWARQQHTYVTLLAATVAYQQAVLELQGLQLASLLARPASLPLPAPAGGTPGPASARLGQKEAFAKEQKTRGEQLWDASLKGTTLTTASSEQEGKDNLLAVLLSAKMDTEEAEDTAANCAVQVMALYPDSPAAGRASQPAYLHIRARTQLAYKRLMLARRHLCDSPRPVAAASTTTGGRTAQPRLAKVLTTGQQGGLQRLRPRLDALFEEQRAESDPARRIKFCVDYMVMCLRVSRPPPLGDGPGAPWLTERIYAADLPSR